MSMTAFVFMVIGVVTVTVWIFRGIDAIEAPARRRNRV